MITILRREFIALLRSRQAFWITLGAVGLASLVPLSAWSAYNDQSFAATAAVAWYGITWSWILFFAVPVVTASSVTTERERGTYELLYNTRIGPAGIVIGKLLASLGFFVVVLALTSPMMCLLYLLGGFEWSQLLVLKGRLLLSMLYFGIVGLWASMRHERTIRAIALAFGVIVGVTLLLSFTRVILYSALGPRNPVAVAIINIGLLVLVSAVLFMRTLRHARMPDAPVKASTARAERKKLLRVSMMPYAPRQRPRRGWLRNAYLARCVTGIPDRWNPVFISTLRSGVMPGGGGRVGLAVGLVALALLLLLLLPALSFVFGTGGSYAGLLGLPLVALGGFVLAVPGLAAATVSSEAELGRLDFVLGTLLKPGEIIRGKFRAIVVSIIGHAGVLVVLTALVFVALFAAGPGQATAVAAAAVVTIVLCATSGLLAASITMRTVPALLVAYALALGYLVVLPLLPLGLHSLFSPIATTVLYLHYPQPFYLVAIPWGITAAVAYIELRVASGLLARRWRHSE